MRLVGIAAALAAMRLVPSLWCGRDAYAWLEGDSRIRRSLAEDLVAFEAADDERARQHGATPAPDSFTGEAVLVAYLAVRTTFARRS